jgi:PAS domain S-box-containing protein
MSNKESTSQEVFTNITAPIIFLDESMNVSYCNPASLSLLGFANHDSLVGLPPWLSIHTDERALFESSCYKAANNQTTVCVKIHFKPASKYLELTIVATGKILTLLFNVISSDKYLNEKERRGSETGEDKFLLYATISNEWIWDWNLVNNGIWRNRSYDDIFGYQHSETSHLDIWKTQVHPDDIERVELSIEQAIEKKSNLWVSEYRFFKNNKEMIFVQDRGVIIYDEQGKANRMVGCKIDISERVLKRPTNYDNEAKYRTIFDRATDSIVIFTINGELLDVNNATTELTGYSYEELIRMKVPEILNKENLKENPIPFDRLMAGEVTTARRPIKTKYGKEKMMELSAKILPDGSFMTIIRDITSISEAEVALKNSERRFRTLASNAPVGIFETNVDGDTVYVNNKMLEYTGFNFEELLAGNWLKAVHEDDIEELVSHWVKMFNLKRESNAEFRIINKNGNVRRISGKAVPLFDKGGYFRGYLGTLTEVTKERQAKEELLKSEEKYRLVIEQASDGIFITDNDGGILSVNFSAEKLLSFNTEELLQKNVKEFLEDEELNGLPEILELLERGQTFKIERTITNSKGEILVIETSTKMLTDGRYLIFARDVTENKKSKSLLLKSYEDIRLLASHLTKVREEERKRIGREIHDELGQKLTAIKMDIAWMQSKMTDCESDIQLSMNNIIELLDAGNLSIRRILTELGPAVMDNYGLIEAVKHLNEQFTKASKIPVAFKTTEVKLQLPQDIANCIFRVYQESLTNVMRHSNATKLTTSLKVVGDQIKLTVEDNGVGFLEAEVESNRSFGVLGMRERILSHNGKFKIVSEKDNGTKVSFALPRYKN